jgi:hypothetical protein
MDITRKAIRAEFKAAGYKASFKTNSLTDKIVSLAFHGKNIIKPEHGSNCYHSDFIKEHKQAFDLKVKYLGSYLVDTEQKIV